MAGKHYGADNGKPSDGLAQPYYPGSREDKAYAEGRAGVPATNPHAAGSDAAAAYDAGVANRLDPAQQLQTAVA